MQIVSSHYCNSFLKTENIYYLRRKQKHKGRPHNGQCQSRHYVVRSIALRLVQTSCTNALSNIHLRSYLSDYCKRIGCPHKNTHSAYRSHLTASQTSHPSHIRETIGHLYERCAHDRKCQTEKLIAYPANCQVLDVAHNNSEYIYFNI